MLFCALVIGTYQIYGISDNFLDRLKLDKNNDNDLALATFLYEMALKNDLSHGEFFGRTTCIEVDRKPNGQFDISLGMKDAAFTAGKVDFDKNSKGYENLSLIMGEFTRFFKEARNELTGEKGYDFVAEVQGYADPSPIPGAKYHYNVDPKIIEKNIAAQRISPELIESSNDYNNYHLATARAIAIKNTFLPKSKATTTGYHSPEKYYKQGVCDKRRGIVVKFSVDPTVSAHKDPSILRPGFQMAAGQTQKRINMSSSINAGYAELDENGNFKNLPKECQGESIKVFAKRSRDMVKKLKDIRSRSRKFWNDYKNDLKNHCKSATSLRINPACSAIQADISDEQDLFNMANVLYTYQNGADKSNPYYKTEEDFMGRSNSKAPYSVKLKKHLYYLAQGANDFEHIADCLSLRKGLKDGVNCKFDDQYIFDTKVKVGNEIVTASKKLSDFNSSHFSACFDGATYYNSTFNQHVLSTDNLIDEKGNVKVEYSSDDIPTIEHPGGEFQGYGCLKCASGIELKGNQYIKNSRAHIGLNHSSIAHTPGMIQDSDNIDKYFLGKEHQGHEHTNAANQLPNLKVYKDCQDPAKRELVKTIPMHNSDQKQKFHISKNIHLKKNECIVKSLIISSCDHSPDGSYKSQGDKAGKYKSVYSFLLGKTLKLATQNSFEESFKYFQDEINRTVISCQGSDSQPIKDSDSLLDQILCPESGPRSLPKPYVDDVTDDCPELTQSKAM